MAEKTSVTAHRKIVYSIPSTTSSQNLALPGRRRSHPDNGNSPHMKHKKDNPWGKPAVTTAAPSASTGPVTAEGKEISSKQRPYSTAVHSDRHAGAAHRKSSHDFQALETVWFRCLLAPAIQAETLLVHELVRSPLVPAARQSSLLHDKEAVCLQPSSGHVGDWTEEQQKSIGRFLRYRTTHTNAVAKCRKAIRRLPPLPPTRTSPRSSHAPQRRASQHGQGQAGGSSEKANPHH